MHNYHPYNDVAFVSDGRALGSVQQGPDHRRNLTRVRRRRPAVARREPGDRIVIDVDARTLDLDVPDSELAARRTQRGEPVLSKSTGYLSI